MLFAHSGLDTFVYPCLRHRRYNASVIITVRRLQPLPTTKRLPVSDISPLFDPGSVIFDNTSEEPKQRKLNGQAISNPDWPTAVVLPYSDLQYMGPIPSWKTTVLITDDPTVTDGTGQTCGENRVNVYVEGELGEGDFSRNCSYVKTERPQQPSFSE